MKELIALAGDLVAERKRLSESLRRLEGTFMRGEVAKEMFKILGVQSSESILSELDGMAKSLDRVGALTKTLVHKINNDRMVNCEPLLADGQMSIEAYATKLDRPVVVECRSNDIKIDRDVLSKFRPIFIEMLETMAEYCIEGHKERIARKKRQKAYFKIDVKTPEEGYRIIAFCDGNGIIPPLASDQGSKLADIGVRATFEGKPGQWSAWWFHVPSGMGSFNCIPVKVAGRKLCIPAWAVLSAERIAPSRQLPAEIWSLDGMLARVRTDHEFETAYGRFLVEVAAGAGSAHYVVEDVLEPEEGFMKPLGPHFNGKGRFMGVVVTESSDEAEHAAHDELALVLNPAYLVYGSSEETYAG